MISSSQAGAWERDITVIGLLLINFCKTMLNNSVAILNIISKNHLERARS